jgi:WD40 repeat protein
LERVALRPLKCISSAHTFSFLLAQLFVWSPYSVQPVQKYSGHRAAVKAIAWSPHQHGILASGGGTTDGCIRFWNTATNTLELHEHWKSQGMKYFYFLTVICDPDLSF